MTGCTSAFAQVPSFNCAKDTHPDEHAICSNAELSQLDNVANAGYEYVRHVYGTRYSKSVTLPLLHARQACGSNIVCIKEQQLAAIQKFQSLGAPAIPAASSATASTFNRPSAQQTDQLDVAVRQQQLDGWEVSLKAFYDRVAYIGFAYGCKIIKAPVQVTLLLLGPFEGFNQQAALMDQHGGYDYLNFNPGFRAAGRAGFERSQLPGQCDYWNEHRDEAIELRSQASRLMNYIGPADEHPTMPGWFRE